MFGLLRRLSALDADAASAVRVIGFFDALVEQGANIDMILHQTAALAECPVGVRSSSGQLCERLEPGGEMRFGGPLAAARRYQLPSGDEVWLERDGAEHPLDDLVLERFALAAAVALGRGHQDLDLLDQSALLQLAVNPTAPDSARRRVLERLGIRATATVHVLALAGAADRLDELGARLPGKHRARIGTLVILLAAQPLQETMAVPVGCRVGIAAPHLAAELPAAWRQACTALRFTLPSRHPAPPYPPYEPPLVRFDDLGSFGAIAESLTAEQIAGLPDVIALDKLAEQPGGEEMLHTLEAVAATDSLRRAAVLLHMHHNSVAHRVARAEQVLGFSIADLYARPRLMLAIALRRVKDSAVLF
jgi:hypothetical protein